MKNKYVYVAVIRSRGSYRTSKINNTVLGYVCRTFKKCKKKTFGAFNGDIEILYKNEEYIETKGLYFALYDIKITNINGTSYYFIDIEKREVQ